MGAENVNTKKLHQILEGTGYITLKLWGQCDVTCIASAESDLTNFLNEKPCHVIVNCEHLTNLSIEWVRFLLKIQLFLRTRNLGMRLVKVHQVLKSRLKKEGVDNAFTICPDLRSAQKDLNLIGAKRLDTDFINPFLTATINVIQVQSKVNVHAGKIYIKKADEQFTGDVSGIIGVVSDSFSGSIVISFPAKTFLYIMSEMLGETCTEINEDIIDGAGEITNQVFGQAKVLLNEKGYGIKTAIPSVVSGKDHSLIPLSTCPRVVIPFESSAGDFFVEICVSE